MGLLDRFRRTENVHFERDASGKVTNVSREYEGRGSRTPVSDALLSQERDKKRQERQDRREAYRQAYQESFKKARIKREAERGRQAGSITWSDRLDNFARAPSTQRRPAINYRVRNNYNPFGNMFDSGMNYKPKTTAKKTSSKVKYKVIGGKAYPLAGTGKKKKKKTNRRTSMGGFDIVDNWRF